MSDDHTPLGVALIDQGRSQTWLALKLSAALGRVVYPQEVHRWCKPGDRTPELETREAIAAELNLPCEELFPGHETGVNTVAGPADNSHRQPAQGGELIA